MRSVLYTLLMSCSLATWPVPGANLFRTNTVYTSLPSDLTGILVEQVITFSDTLQPTLLPPLLATKAGSTLAVLVDSTHCVVQLWLQAAGSTQGYQQVANWQCPSVSNITAAPALSFAGDLLVIATTGGDIFGINTAIGDENIGNTVWGPVNVGAPVNLDVTVMGVHAWVVTATGMAYAVAVSNGQVLPVPSASCGGGPDRYVSSFTMLSAFGPRFVATTGLGCLVSVNDNAQIVWTSARLNGFSSATEVFPPAVDVDNNQLYVSTAGGLLCCASTGGVSPCINWGSMCVELPITAPMVKGVAITPDDVAFHSGQIFSFDANGILYTVFAAAGVNVSSVGSFVLDPVVTAPIVVPNALGDDINVMLVLTTTGVLQALYVGDAPVSDDDTSDDDGYGNDGIAWSFQLTPNTTNTALRSAKYGIYEYGAPVINVNAIAVGPDGYIYVPTADGRLIIIGPQHAPPNPAPETNVIVVISVVVAVAAIGIAVTAWCALRHRRRALAAQRHPSMFEGDVHDSETDDDDLASSLLPDPPKAQRMTVVVRRHDNL